MIAILAIVFGGLAVLCTPIFNWKVFALDPAAGTDDLAMKPYLDSSFLRIEMQVSVVLGFLASIALLASGIGMLQLRAWARSLALGWATFSIVAGVLNTILMLTLYLPAFSRHLEEVDEATRAAVRVGVYGGVVGGACFSLLLPIAVCIVLTRPAVKAAFGLVTAGTPQPAARAYEPPPPTL